MQANFCLLSRALANAVLCPCNFFWIYKSEKESLSEGVVCSETVLYEWDILAKEGKEELDKYELNIWPVPQSSRDRLGGQERGGRDAISKHLVTEVVGIPSRVYRV